MSKSAAKPTAFSKTLLAGAVAMSVALMAQGQSISEDDRALLEQTDERIEKVIDDMELEALEQQAQANVNRHQESTRVPELEDRGTVENQRQKAQEASEKFYREHEIIIFASLSLEGQGLDDILQAAAANPRIAVVFRGVPEGMKIDEGMEIIQKLAYEYDPMPTVALDPTMFDEHGIEAVPAIVVMESSSQKAPANDIPSLDTLLDEGEAVPDVLSQMGADALGSSETRDVLAKVQGLTEPMWIKRQLEAGERGDMGVQGPLEDIEEPHLIKVMKQKALAIDWDAEKQGAIDRFWPRQNEQLIWKPTVKEAETRRIDPSVTVVQDIVDGRGNVLTPAGTKINPLDQMPFDIALVVFDGDDEGQLEIAYERGRELERQEGIHQVMYLMTHFDTLKGWDGYEAISDTLDRHVYLLTPDVEKRFEIERVPSIVTADDTHFIVEEVVPPTQASPDFLTANSET
ncbi:TrbC family F-type conjugative pilus assembly protein [Vreelandella massiliensis]|uniref:TrbC family F-type conjugative pilus assembly protein n=1 Tax=Vreelandella massiliensis TaxID=1816686 RepID=UPI00096ABE3E|nr:TrbC family F-type conjugative pilus assembly protein [Halomonas massiliensis]